MLASNPTVSFSPSLIVRCAPSYLPLIFIWVLGTRFGPVASKSKYFTKVPSHSGALHFDPMGLVRRMLISMQNRKGQGSQFPPSSPIGVEKIVKSQRMILTWQVSGLSEQSLFSLSRGTLLLLPVCLRNIPGGRTQRKIIMSTARVQLSCTCER